MELDDDDTSNKGPFGVVSTDGRNAFGAMKRAEVQRGLDQFLPEELFWMKKMFWRFHLGSTTVFYKQLNGSKISRIRVQMGQQRIMKISITL